MHAWGDCSSIYTLTAGHLSARWNPILKTYAVIISCNYKYIIIMKYNNYL